MISEKKYSILSFLGLAILLITMVFEDRLPIEAWSALLGFSAGLTCATLILKFLIRKEEAQKANQKVQETKKELEETLNSPR